MGANVPIYTSYFGKRSIHNGDYTVVNIAISTPKWYKGNLETYRYAVPPARAVVDWNNSDKDEQAMVAYIRRYWNETPHIFGQDSELTHLEHLLQFKEDMIEEHGRKPIVLSCYETSGNFCHRLVYTTYLKLFAGLTISELDYKPESPSPAQIIITETLQKLARGGI